MVLLRLNTSQQSTPLIISQFLIILMQVTLKEITPCNMNEWLSVQVMQLSIWYLLLLLMQYASMTCNTNSVWRGAGAEAGELVLKQQEQLAALARQHRRQPPSTPDGPNVTSEHAGTDIKISLVNLITNETTIMTADTCKPTDQATDSVTGKARLMVSIHSSLLLHQLICPSAVVLTLLSEVDLQSSSTAATAQSLLCCVQTLLAILLLLCAEGFITSFSVVTLYSVVFSFSVQYSPCHFKHLHIILVAAGKHVLAT